MTKQQIFDTFKKKYSAYSPDFELWIKAEQVERLNALVLEKNAVILKHNYMTWDLQCDEVIGFRGDSLELSKKAAATDAKVILFLGVKFMAETAKILNPDKTVLIPSLRAGCSLASSITGADVRMLKKMYPNVPVVAYVNTDADTKSEVDVCCTSSNAAKVVRWAMDTWKTRQVIFLPDEFLTRNIAREIGAAVIFPTREKKRAISTSDMTLIGWPGRCEVHEKFTKDDVSTIKESFPGVYIMAHPECPPEVVDRVDFSGSTSAMIKEVQKPAIQKRPVAFFTECAMVEMLASQHKNVIQACSIQKRCPHMATNNLETAIKALETMQHPVAVSDTIRKKAEIPIRRMIAIT